MSATKKPSPTTKTRSPRGGLFDPIVGTHRPKLIRNGAIFVVLAAIFLYIIYTKPSIPFISSGGKTVTAKFAYAVDVFPGRTPVEEYGVVVGTVKSIERGPGGRGAIVKMTMNGGGATLHSDASATLSWKTLLGLNYYIDLTPGSPSAPPLGNQMIPESRTSSQVEVDQVLAPLDAQGRNALGTMLDQFNKGFSNPAAVRNTLSAAAPAMKNLAAGLPGLRGTDPGHDLPYLIASTDAWMGALARDDDRLGDLVNKGATVVSTTAANEIDLGDTFNNAPQALQQTQATMVRLRKTLNVLNPIAQQLEPGAQQLAGSAQEAQKAVLAAQPLLTNLKPTLAAIRPSVNSLSAAAKVGVPVVKNLTPTFNRVLSTYIPWLDSTNPNDNLKVYEEIGPTVGSLSSVLGYGDQYGTLAGFEAGAGENVVGGQSPCSTFLTDPNVSLDDKVDCEALANTVASLFSGDSATSVSLKDSPVASNLVNSLLKKAGL